MTDGFFVEGGKITINKGARTVATSDGTLVNLLGSPSINTTFDVAFPDFPKGKAYWWQFVSDYNDFASQYGWISEGRCQFTRTPQEWSQPSIIGVVPAGADLFKSRIRISRTGAPTHTWVSQSIDVLPKENVWMPFNGSCLVEAELGMARAFSIYISGSDLVLHRQQTMGPPSGGFGSAGNASPGLMVDTAGQEWSARGGAEGMSVWSDNNSPYYKYSSGTSPSLPLGTYDNHKWSGSDPCSETDPTNYASTYSVDLIGQFGRRS